MHPVIILWAHPRSMSTAIERVIRERGDLDCLHEPFLHYYYLQRSEKALPHFDSEQDHPTSSAKTPPICGNFYTITCLFMNTSKGTV